jgi:phosphoenolpyruvate carboxykinase (ATP)
MNIRTALELSGLTHLGAIHHNLSAPHLYEHALFLGEGITSQHGAFVVKAHEHQTPPAISIVEEPTTKKSIVWNEARKPIAPHTFDALKTRITAYLQSRDVYVQDCYAGASPKYRLPIRIVTEKAWHSLAARNVFVQPEPQERSEKPAFTVICVPNFKAAPALDGVSGEAFAIINFAQGVVLIGGTQFAGTMKNAVLTVMSQLMPAKKVLPMHCSVSVGKQGDAAIIFGLSGTGKTTLAAAAERRLVGNDAHGWAEEGIFNFEGGCYAKAPNLAVESEPMIVAMTRTFGTVLEQVKMDAATRAVHLGDAAFADRIRASYPRESLKTLGDVIIPSNKASHAKHIFFLAADAFGVLPLIARLTPEQALFYFLSGYTSERPATKDSKEPVATFSACFGERVMTQSPAVYAAMLQDRIANTKPYVWLVNTGWSGGEAGKGQRIKLEHTRAVLKAAVQGELDAVEFVTEPVFKLAVPKHCSGVQPQMLMPRNAWKNAKEYDAQAAKLRAMFVENFEQKIGTAVDASILASFKGEASTGAAAKKGAAQGKQPQQKTLTKQQQAKQSGKPQPPAKQQRRGAQLESEEAFDAETFEAEALDEAFGMNERTSANAAEQAPKVKPDKRGKRSKSGSQDTPSVDAEVAPVKSTAAAKRPAKNSSKAAPQSNPRGQSSSQRLFQEQEEMERQGFDESGGEEFEEFFDDALTSANAPEAGAAEQGAPPPVARSGRGRRGGRNNRLRRSKRAN